MTLNTPDKFGPHIYIAGPVVVTFTGRVFHTTVSQVVWPPSSASLGTGTGQLDREVCRFRYKQITSKI